MHYCLFFMDFVSMCSYCLQVNASLIFHKNELQLPGDINEKDNVILPYSACQQICPE